MLGRWAYITLQGKNNTKTRIYSIYVPVKSMGENTAYKQQARFHIAKGDIRCPRQIMIEDLKKSLKDAKDKGENLIIGGDLNAETTTSPWKEIADEFDLKDAIRDAHGNRGPSTWAFGQSQIDAILVTRSLQVNACGYLPYTQAVGDHRTIWVDLPHESILGHRTPRFPTKSARRLTTRDPRVTKKYLTHLKWKFRAKDVGNRVEDIYQQAIENPEQLNREETNRIFQYIQEIMEEAEAGCRKFKTGPIEFLRGQPKGAGSSEILASNEKETGGKKSQ